MEVVYLYPATPPPTDRHPSTLIRSRVETRLIAKLITPHIYIVDDFGESEIADSILADQLKALPCLLQHSNSSFGVLLKLSIRKILAEHKSYMKVIRRVGASAYGDGY